MNTSQAEGIDQLQSWVNESKRIVFFGGAGVSTESGIPDFRSVDGLYHQKYDYPPETILSHTFFMRNTKAFYDFYRDKMICLDAKPNITHLKLAEMEQKGFIKQQAAKRYTNSMDPCTAITAPNAIHFMIFTVLPKAQAFRLVNVVVLSSRMLYYTKRD